MPENDILRGWKEIEAYLGVSRKTVLLQCYPVRREGSGKSGGLGSVFAFKNELIEYARQRNFVSEEGAAHDIP